MKILVLGATGNVGSLVARGLLERQHQVRVLTRSAAKAQALGSKVEIVEGSLLDPLVLRTLCDGVDGAFLLNGLSLTEAGEGLMAVSAAMDSGLRRLVYMSVQHVDRAPYLPHFGSKLAVEAGVKASGIPWTILRPSNFFQNDYAVRDALLRYGIYPQPLGDLGVSRVDIRDIAELATITLIEAGHESKVYDVVGPRPWSGAQVAEAWSSALGRPIAYAGNDLDAWEARALEFLPPWLAYDLKRMYAHFRTHGLVGTEAEVGTVTRLLGHPPRSFEAFAGETARAWSAHGAAVAKS